MNKSLENTLQQLGLLKHNAVFFSDEENGPIYEGFSTEIKQKLGIIKPEAYFVFNSLPLLLFFDLTESRNQEREREIHKQVWSFDQAPVIFVIKNTEVKVYNAFAYNKSNKEDANEGLAEIILTDTERNEKFSFWNLQSGETWKWLQAEHFEKAIRNKRQKRVNQQLFENIKAVRERLTGTSTDTDDRFSDDQANTLILRLIFIRYLIDRNVKIDEQFITGETISQRRLCFSKLIENPTKLNRLFDKLNARFNGVLFKDVNIQLDGSRAKGLAKIFRGERPEPGTVFYGIDHIFFDVFDFSIIPVEVISGIYESLIDPETRKLDAAVYTPSFLVDYILQDTVEKYIEQHDVTECKVFDPAVGSGIFLVQSLRKMVEKERTLYPNQSPSQFSERIRSIAKSNLFGIDVNPQALKVASFSIYIALLDYQEPKDIDKYLFPDLSNNLFCANFFNSEHQFNSVVREQHPQFILGNPPWKSDKDEIHTAWLKTNRKTVGRQEIAQSFLLRTKDFMDETTQSALVITSTIFYNVAKTTKTFKAEFLRTFCIDKFFDLSPVRRLIFEEKNSPASIVYFRLSNGNDYLTNVLKHQSIKINHFLKYFKMLVIEKHDQKEIAQKHFIENDWMFKVALYGNTLDFSFLQRLFKLTCQTIGDIIDDKTLYAGAGVARGSDAKPFLDFVGLPIIENDSITQDYYSLADYKVLKEEDVIFARGRKPELFVGPRVLFKEQNKNESEPLVTYTDESFVFRKGVFSISASDSELIRVLYPILKSSLYTYYLYLVSCAWGVATRPAIRFKEEFLSFPLIELAEDIRLRLVGLADQFIRSYKNYYLSKQLDQPQRNGGILSQFNDFVKEVYEVSPHEQDLIDYVLQVSRYQFQESKQHKFLRKVHTDKAFLSRYASVYVEEFANIYPDEYLHVEVYPWQHFIAMNFVLQKDKSKGGEVVVFPADKQDEETILKRLANNLSINQITDAIDPTKNLYIQKDIKGFEKNSFYVIKPNEFKSWHRAMAWYDVAEFKEYIEHAELHHLTHNNANALF